MATANHQFQITGDGSLTIFSDRFQEAYHSKHGAATESIHVYIHAGLKYRMEQKEGLLKIGEIGLGTGMNALLSLQVAEECKRPLEYTSIEAFPIDNQLIQELKKESWAGSHYEKLMAVAPGNVHHISPFFAFFWQRSVWPETNPFQQIDVLFYDAFSPMTQPELWNVNAFQSAWDCMAPGGVLVTYCAKGYVKRNLKEVGFLVEKLPGAPGKAEMTRAIKPVSS